MAEEMHALHMVMAPIGSHAWSSRAAFQSPKALSSADSAEVNPHTRRVVDPGPNIMTSLRKSHCDPQLVDPGPNIMRTLRKSHSDPQLVDPGPRIMQTAAHGTTLPRSGSDVDVVAVAKRLCALVKQPSALSSESLRSRSSDEVRTCYLSRLGIRTPEKPRPAALCVTELRVDAEFSPYLSVGSSITLMATYSPLGVRSQGS
jgi:hypothetical protein